MNPAAFTRLSSERCLDLGNSIPSSSASVAAKLSVVAYIPKCRFSIVLCSLQAHNDHSYSTFLGSKSFSCR